MTSHEDYREWWLVFRDPTLNRLVEMAYAQNLTLMAAGARVIEARALLGEAIGEFYPQMQQVNGSATYLQPSETDATSNPDTVITARQFWRVNIGGEAAWELDLWGKFRRGVEQADAAYLASIASYDDVLVTLIGDVASDYLGMRTLEAQIAIARANVVKQQQALQIARDRFNGGPTSELDAFQAENVLAATQATIPQLTSQLLQTKNALGVLLGVPPSSVDALLSGSRGVPSPPRNVAVGIPADLLRRRADVRAAELRAEAQSAKVGIAAADLYPAFSLGGALGTLVSTTNGNKINQLFTPPSPSLSARRSTGPCSTTARSPTPCARRTRSSRRCCSTTRTRFSRRGARSRTASAVSNRAVGRRNAVAASKALTVALDQYQLGTRDFTTVLTAEQNLARRRTISPPRRATSPSASRTPTALLATDGRSGKGTTS
jgi:NodT family efflux transporter outer membrane factor (OMF) lipoprotein